MTGPGAPGRHELLGKPAADPEDPSSAGVGVAPWIVGRVGGQPRDPLIAALARYVEALHRRYPEGPERMRREGLDGRANITPMLDRRRGPAA